MILVPKPTNESGALLPGAQGGATELPRLA